MKPLVSAIVSTCDRAGLLSGALDSVLAQDGVGEGFDLEVIVVDDASTDATSDVVACYPSVRYVRLPERRGASAARNAGVAASRGRYIAFLDDDDLWLPGKLRLQVPALAAHPEAGAVYSHVIARGDGPDSLRPTEANPHSGAVFLALLRGNVLGGVLRFLIRRAALDVAGSFDETVPTGEDYDLWLRLAFHFPIVFVPGPVGVWRVNPRGKRATNMSKGLSAERIRYVAEKAIALLPDTPEHAALREQARVWAEMRVVTQLSAAEDAGAVLPRMVEALSCRPAIVRDAEVRAALLRTAQRCVAASGAPLAAARAVCGEIGAAVRGRLAADDRWRLQRLLAAIWWRAGADLLWRARRWRAVSSGVRRLLRRVHRGGSPEAPVGAASRGVRDDDAYPSSEERQTPHATDPARAYTRVH